MDVVDRDGTNENTVSDYWLKVKWRRGRGAMSPYPHPYSHRYRIQVYNKDDSKDNTCKTACLKP